MPTHLIHIGDFHAAQDARNADRYRALDSIIRVGEELKERGTLGAWLWPGDLFDATSTAADRNALDDRIKRMSAVAPVVICYGNHDRAGELEGFANLKGEWPVIVCATAGCIVLQLATGQRATVFVLPYPDKARLVAAGLGSSELVATAGDVLEPIFMANAHWLEQAREGGDLTLMIGHINVRGAITSSGQPNIGREIELDPRHLDRLGNIPKLLNHIHKPQEIHGALYAGSVARQDYGEIEEKRFLIISFYTASETDGGTGAWSIASRPLDVPPMFHVEGELTRDGFSLDPSEYPDGPVNDEDRSKYETARRFEARDWRGCDVRVRYRFRASERELLSKATVEAMFAGALRLKVEGFAEADRDVRAPEVARATTLEGKLAAMRGGELPSSLAAKLALLEGASLEAIAVAVSADIRAIEDLAGTPETATVAA